jgi:endonuclease/exonuclease/phosphatase family metal-dependent hydrolase
MTRALSRSALTCIWLLTAATHDVAAQALDVMTFNMRFAHAAPNSWEARRTVVKALLEKYAPDIVGTQEGVHRQLRDLQADLPAYAWIGEGRDGGERGEYMAIFYRRERFDLLQHEHFWLSDTPGVAGSRTWGNTNSRMVTWVELRDRRTQCTFYVANTHFDHEVQVAREKGANLLLERVNQLDRALPVILLGDFNAAAGANPVYDILTGKDAFVDVWRKLGKPEPPFGTFHDFKGEEAARGLGRIDWILTRGAVKARSSAIVTFADGKQYPSDHFPVVAELELDKAGCSSASIR